MSDLSCLADCVGDLVLFRDLNPVDARLPRFEEAWASMGIQGPARPRKHEPAYAQAVVWYLQRARALENHAARLNEILYIGDTALSDGNAFRNVRAAGDWRGWAFICSERDEPPSITEQDGVCVANRWSSLPEFISRAAWQGATLGASTAVIVDIDKTALGARGRNDRPIDRARLAAMEAMLAEVLGDLWNSALFHDTYSQLNVPRFHSFTADNQDYLAYICLIVGARVCSLADLQADLADGRLTNFVDFVARTDAQSDGLPTPAVRAAHEEVQARVRAGDPTPFKAFRRREYLETVCRMGSLSDRAPLDQRLREEICLTREVIELVDWLRNRGCLPLALSDKPDEASVPTDALASTGCRPLHRAMTHIAGPSIAGQLLG
jgi:hypothetical protein